MPTAHQEPFLLQVLGSLPVADGAGGSRGVLPPQWRPRRFSGQNKQACQKCLSAWFPSRIESLVRFGFPVLVFKFP